MFKLGHTILRDTHAVQTMLRRNPTKIELKIEDVQELEKKLKIEAEAKKNECQQEITDNSIDIPSLKTRKEVIEERIGYNPRPRNAK